MDKRIKEFADQVGMSIEYLTNTKQIVLLEKFTELLIRDVTETAVKFRQSKTRPVGWNFRATVLNEYGLKEHD